MGSVSIGEATNGERSEETPRLRKSRATREQRGSCVIRDEARRTLILICPRRGEHGNLRGRCITSFFKRIVDRTRWCIPNGYSSLKRATAFPHRPNRNERNLRRETKLQSRCSFFFFFSFFLFSFVASKTARSIAIVARNGNCSTEAPFLLVFRALYNPPSSRSIPLLLSSCHRHRRRRHHLLSIAKWATA